MISVFGPYGMVNWHVPLHPGMAAITTWLAVVFKNSISLRLLEISRGARA